MNRQSAALAPGHGAPDADELARAAATAAALLELAIEESLAPVTTLGRALSHMSEAREPAAERGATLDACIESLQFHDRLVQQLTQVRDLLAGAAGAHLLTTDPCGWPALRERLRAQFTSESHRMLFNLLMPGEAAGVPVRLHAEEGSVELF
jgi:hypothetical protein